MQPTNRKIIVLTVTCAQVVKAVSSDFGIIVRDQVPEFPVRVSCVLDEMQRELQQNALTALLASQTKGGLPCLRT